MEDRKTFDEVYEKYFPERKPSLTNIMCPITGAPLVWIPDNSHMHTMDPDSIYESASDPTIRFARHPFSRRTFRLIDKYESDLGRYFVLSEDETSWTEFKRVKGISDLIPIDTPQEEIDARIEKEAADSAERKRIYDEKVARGEIVPLPTIRVTASTMRNSDIVEVAPLPPPSGLLFYMDMKSEDQPIISGENNPGKKNWLQYIKQLVKNQNESNNSGKQSGFHR